MSGHIIRILPATQSVNQVLGGKSLRVLSRGLRIMRSSTALTRLMSAGAVAMVTGAMPLPFTGEARAQAVWIGGTDSDYHTASNWNPASVPNSTAINLLRL